MSVLSCSRNGCESIMCSRYSDEHGYICDECLDSLKSLGRVDIHQFMLTRKDNNSESKRIGWEAELEAEFRIL